MIIRARAPLRLGLAGGGTDVDPFCSMHGGVVLNATIDRYAYAVIKELNTDEIVFNSTDQQKHINYELTNNFELDGVLDLHKAVYNRFINEFNDGKPVALEITTFCDAPAGSGLGSSSTVVVSMVKAFCELLNLPLDDYAQARLSYEIERIDCKLKGGRQDQYAATFGGFNYMEFHKDEVAIINKLRIRECDICELEASLILFYTGRSRESARIIETQRQNVTKGNLEAVESMMAIRHEAMEMKNCLMKGDLNGIVESMRAGWENKKKTSRAVSNSHIEEIYSAAINNGALAGKVSGAGGGGYMIFFTPPEKRMDVFRTLRAFNGVVSNCHFTQNGSQSWRI